MSNNQPPLLTICIIGPQICDKTSLLFQQAIVCAEQGQKVLFITPSRLEQLPLLSSDKPPSSVLERIHFKYPSTLYSLQEIFDSLHEVNSPHEQRPGSRDPGYHGVDGGMYSCIILDKFHQYFVPMLQCKSHEQITAVARTCAHAVDALKFLSSRPAAGNCSCLLSMDEPTPVQGLKLDTVQRWFPLVLKITSAGDDCSYVISRWDSKDQEKQQIASYTIHQTHFEWHEKLRFHQ